MTVFLSKEERILSIVGKNTYKNEDGRTYIRYYHRPNDMHMRLPSKYNRLPEQELYKVLSMELKQLFQHKNIKGSFLDKAEYIRASWNGEILYRSGANS